MNGGFILPDRETYAGVNPLRCGLMPNKNSELLEMLSDACLETVKLLNYWLKLELYIGIVVIFEHPRHSVSNLLDICQRSRRMEVEDCGCGPRCLIHHLQLIELPNHNSGCRFEATERRGHDVCSYIYFTGLCTFVRQGLGAPVVSMRCLQCFSHNIDSVTRHLTDGLISPPILLFSAPPFVTYQLDILLVLTICNPDCKGNCGYRPACLHDGRPCLPGSGYFWTHVPNPLLQMEMQF